MLPDGLSLHDAVIVAVDRVGNDIVLHVEHAQVPGGSDDFDLANCIVTLRGVREVLIDDQPAVTIAMAGEDGEILRFDWVNEGRVEAFVLWAENGGAGEVEHFYKIACAGIAWGRADTRT